MNVADRAELADKLTIAIEEAFDDLDFQLPLFGRATVRHMALAAVNVVEAVADSNEYIAQQLNDETRDNLGL